MSVLSLWDYVAVQQPAATPPVFYDLGEFQPVLSDRDIQDGLRDFLWGKGLMIGSSTPYDKLDDATIEIRPPNYGYHPTEERFHHDFGFSAPTHPDRWLIVWASATPTLVKPVFKPVFKPVTGRAPAMLGTPLKTEPYHVYLLKDDVHQHSQPVGAYKGDNRWFARTFTAGTPEHIAQRLKGATLYDLGEFQPHGIPKKPVYDRHSDEYAAVQAQFRTFLTNLGIGFNHSTYWSAEPEVRWQHEDFNPYDYGMPYHHDNIGTDDCPWLVVWSDTAPTQLRLCGNRKDAAYPRVPGHIDGYMPPMDGIVVAGHVYLIKDEHYGHRPPPRHPDRWFARFHLKATDVPLLNPKMAIRWDW